MSLLADLLSKIKQPEQAREVPPNLKNIVQSSASKSAAKRKIIIFSVIIAFLIIGGIGAVYLINSISGTSDLGVPDQQLSARRQLMPISNGTAKQTVQTKAKAESAPQTAGPAAPAPVKKKALVAKKKKQRGPASASKNNTQAENRKKQASAPDRTKAEEIDVAARDALLYKARDYELKHDYSSAINTYKEALDMDSGNVMVLNSIAYTYLKLGLVEESIEYAHKAEELDVQYVPALINLGIGYAQSGDASAAEYYLTRAFKLEPDNRQALFNLALHYEQKGQLSEASGSFKKLMQLGDMNGTIGMARVYEKLGNHDASLKLYRKAASQSTLNNQQRVQVRQRIMVLQNAGNNQTAKPPPGITR